jgi:acetate kinase
MTATFLTVNPGSATIKLGLFAIEAGQPRRIGHAVIDYELRILRITDGPHRAEMALAALDAEHPEQVLGEVLASLAGYFPMDRLAAIGQRIVHGGDQFVGPAVISADVLAKIESLTPLAPLHQARSVRLIRELQRLHPGLPQIACFDTAFHRSQSDLVRRFAIPRHLFDEGVKRYGFHGLSYQFIAAELERRAPAFASGHVVAAHLGSGASLCAIDAGISRDTTMGFSTLDGVPMATRCGSLDAGVLIHLIKERGLSIDAVEDMLYNRSGLLGVSGISGDSRALIKSDTSSAREALNLFAFRVAREIAALATTMGGLDTIVFTGGIGEHQPSVREAVCRFLAWLGVALDQRANESDAFRIDAPASKVAVLVINADEEQTIADEGCALLPIDAADPRV